MSSRKWQQRIRDILNAISSIQKLTANMTFEDFIARKTIVKAVLYDFIVIGEAAKSIPTKVQKCYSEIPWLSMGDMQNVVTHEYFRVDLEIAWDSVQNDLAPLTIQLQSLIECETDPLVRNIRD